MSVRFDMQNYSTARGACQALPNGRKRLGKKEIVRQKPYTFFLPVGIYWYVHHREGGSQMKQYPHDDSIQSAGPSGDVDDLIFCTDPAWSASSR